MSDARSGLSLQGISKQFGAIAALTELSMEIGRGEIHGLIGPNGAGKTTAVNVATGIYRPSAGSVLLDGADVTSMCAHRRATRGLGRSFQGARLFDGLDVETNIRVSVEQRRKHQRQSCAKGDVFTEVGRLMEEAHLTPVARRDARSLPYGIRKQVEIVRSCAFASCALLLDEPTSGLSPEEIDRVLGIIRRHHARLAVLIIEHDMEVIMSMCDRVTVIDAGRWLMTGTPAEVQQDQEVIRAYLGSDE